MGRVIRDKEHIYDLMKREIYFVHLPLAVIHNERSLRTKAVGRTLTGGSAPVSQSKTVGRTIIELARLAAVGIPIHLDNKEEAIDIYNRLKEYLDTFDMIIIMPNMKTEDIEDIESAKVFAEMIIKNQHTNINSQVVESFSKFTSIFDKGPKYNEDGTKKVLRTVTIGNV